MIPVMGWVADRRRVGALFGAALAWSVAAQFAGAWSYNQLGWMEQWQGGGDPDRASLWQWTRPQIVWHMANFGEQRAVKHAIMREYVGRPGAILYLRR